MVQNLYKYFFEWPLNTINLISTTDQSLIVFKNHFAKVKNYDVKRGVKNHVLF